MGNEGASDALDALEQHSNEIALPYISLALTDGMIDSGMFEDFLRSDHAPFWHAGLRAVRPGPSRVPARPRHPSVGDQT